MDESQLENLTESIETREEEIAQDLSEIEIDAALIAEFEALVDRTQSLKVAYQSLINSRRFLNNG